MKFSKSILKWTKNEDFQNEKVFKDFKKLSFKNLHTYFITKQSDQLIHAKHMLSVEEQSLRLES